MAGVCENWRETWLSLLLAVAVRLEDMTTAAPEKEGAIRAAAVVGVIDAERKREDEVRRRVDVLMSKCEKGGDGLRGRRGGEAAVAV